jgi:hypothetical protein
MRAFKMTRFLLAVPFLLIFTAASAQSGRPDPGCARDVSRFCRAHMDEGDQIILACLKTKPRAVEQDLRQGFDGPRAVTTLVIPRRANWRV